MPFLLPHWLRCSLSARRAWIEIRIFPLPRSGIVIALRKESVDRNIPSGILFYLLSIALRKESVDRNLSLLVKLRTWKIALRKESVDRNGCGLSVFLLRGSLSARRAWIEISLLKASKTGASVALRKESVDRNIFSSYLPAIL